MSEDPTVPPEFTRRLDEIIEFRRSLTQESDQGCALLASAYLDSELDGLLRARLVQAPEVLDELFRASGPLGSFAVRIDLAYAIGLIGEDVRRDLHLIRKVRNDFGHSAKRLTFDEPAIAARCRETRYSILEPDAPPRHRFTNTVLGVAAMVHAAYADCSRLPPGRDIVLPTELRAEARRVADEFLRRLVRQGVGGLGDT